MSPGETASLQLPAFLHGTSRSVQQKVKREGLRCAEQYRKEGAFPAPRQLLEVPLGEVVVAQGVVDFQHEHPAWRLYRVSDVLREVWEALQWEDSSAVRDAYEASFLETAWGALFFTLARMGPVSAERTARRLEAVLRFWDPLDCARYLFKKPGAAQTLEELMVDACGWAMDAWCPEREGPVRARLEGAAERMARATREDCLEAILRQMPRALAAGRDLKHRQVLADPVFQRERLTRLDTASFERVSGACTSELLEKLYDWDQELGLQ
ncbi:MAG TPA: hypothetical protein VFZ09_25835 [Archangium sp.]|uniref:hypothetical protein n=1 Tax=Archangium sp. TaxID=1872627 RepID=UPI002E337876|nr:hypothetical protein [Archangium sp.]HEX5749678.1 hypothetical protein [Archangium sp.]